MKRFRRIPSELILRQLDKEDIISDEAQIESLIRLTEVLEALDGSKSLEELEKLKGTQR